MIERFINFYPTLVEVVSKDLLERKIVEMREPYFSGGAELARPIRRHSRGFWNTVATVFYEEEERFLRPPVYILDTIELGLVQAKRCGKHFKFHSVLTHDDQGFFQVLAELYLLGRLGTLAQSLDLEVSGREPGRNYDLKLVFEEGLEVHLDCKWRTATPLGEINSDYTLYLQELLGSTFDAVACATARLDQFDTTQLIDIAVMVDEARKMVKGIIPPGPPLDVDVSDQLLRGPALGMACHYIFSLGERVHLVNLGDIAEAYFVPSESRFFVNHGVLAEIEISYITDNQRENPGTCIFIPAAESQAAFSIDCRRKWEAHQERSLFSAPNDVEIPEYQRIRDLIRSVYNQLPLTSFNIVFVGVEHSSVFRDVEIALYGETAPTDGDLNRLTRIGGLFSEPSFNHICGVITFTLNLPSILSSEKPVQSAQFFMNEACTPSPPDFIARQLILSLQG